MHLSLFVIIWENLFQIFESFLFHEKLFWILFIRKNLFFYKHLSNIFYLWESLFLMRTFFLKFLWKYASILMLLSWTYRLSSKHDNDVFFIWYVPNLCFFPWILLILCLSIFLLHKVSLSSLNSVVIFIPFAVQDSLPSIFYMEYIFDFHPINSPIIFPSG